MKKIGLCILLLFVPWMVLAEELPVVCQEFAPYNYLDKDGNVTGASYEIVVEALKRMNFEPNVKLLPLNRAYETAASGKAAMLFTFSKNPEREKELFFSDGIIYIEVVFFKRKSDNITWNMLEDVKDYRIGYVDGYYYGSTFMEALQQKKFNKTDAIPASETVDYQQLTKLTNNRIDLAVCPKTQCTRIIKMYSPELDGVDYIDKSIGPVREFYAGFSKKWPNAEALRDQFNEELKKLIAEGTRDNIFKKYDIAVPENK
ncbi:putative amino acid ABC transporter [Candidatus Vecturithrix granuli]|uniref:Putative amino acid ABC transporter n=1 Tax=Vecturithrix granuli TaxID=1499967 RepID=A0A081C0M1_VECG1|nr:putative amino acid ABC transporter [Candidatus Vecturithrix granuli]